ncbi:nucleolar protein 58 isoform X2 [Odontomachus brunneus]|uniref:nucleolar protein 58 isoform X2 n=1 Tax=Odontomachus brunneus TaxID=486640 RepID=UPI0013F276AC|nr:nucleolar protein 58 isoform X2 [Odontomachus brunneus]
MESNPKESSRKDCSNLRGRERKVDLISTYSGVTCKADNCYHATNSKSSLEIRYVNSAIYTKPVSEEERDALKSEIRSELNDRQREHRYKMLIGRGGSKSSVIDLADVALHTATEDGTSEQAITGQNTYRCYSTTLPDATLCLERSTTRSVVSSETIARVERRCKIDSTVENVCQNEAVRRERYIDMDNRQVMRISITSLSDPDVSNCRQLSSGGTDFARRIAYSEWIRRKHKAAQRKREDEERAMKKRQEEEEKTTQKKEERARLEKQNFLKWIEGKRRQELDRKAMLQNELELQTRLKEIEDKAAIAKTLYLRQWIHKKKEEQKVRHKEQESRQRKINEEREERLEQCSKAYERWRQDSKNRPKPATQGLLPHQKAKPAYVNPIPWQPIVEIDSDEAEEDALNDKNRDASQLRMNSGRTVVAHQ